MARALKELVICSTCIYIMIVAIAFSESKPQSGVIGGYTSVPANAVLMYNMTNSSLHHHDYTAATTVERGAPWANGCFKQIVKEPDSSDMKRFIATEQLICPPGVNITYMTQQSQKPGGAHIPTPFYTNPPDVGFVQPNTTGHPVTFPYAQVYYTPAVLPVPANGTPIAVLPPPSSPMAPLPPVLTQQKYQPDVFNPQQPVMAKIPDQAQVVVLSKTTGYYETNRKTNSASNTLSVANGLAFVLGLAIFSRFM